MMDKTFDPARIEARWSAAWEKAGAFKAGRVRVLVATDIASRGIDVDGITHVVNFDFPDQLEDYVHRIGRTGRAQATGKSVTFITSEDVPELRRLERLIGKPIPKPAKAEGFDYAEATRQAFAAPAPDSAPRPHHRGPGHGRREREQRAQPPRPGAWHGGRGGQPGPGSSGGQGGQRPRGRNR